MKRILISLLVIFILANVNSFSQNISYDYDLTGNRIKRAVITLKSAKLDSTSHLLYDEQSTMNKDLGSENIRVYPNPTSDLLRVSVSYPVNNSTVKIKLYDVNSRLIFNKETDNYSESINMSVYSSGIYILRVEVNSETKEWKIIKE